MRRFRILVVDDDKSIVKVLKGYLSQAGFEVLRAYDGETCMHMLRREKPDLLILDLMLPDRDGWDMTRSIRADENLSTIPIIMLTARVGDSDKIVGLEIGADDYITKPFNPREVVARVRAMLRRTQFGDKKPPRILQIEGLHLDLDQHELIINDEPMELTPTEFKLLQVLMENPGYTQTREELLEKSVGYAYEGMGRTLDTHIRNIRKRLNLTPTSPPISIQFMG